MDSKPSLLYLTDLYFEANGRDYFDEDFYITSMLRKNFYVLICHPQDSQNFESLVDLVVFRNTGPVLHYQSTFNKFVSRVNANETACYNSMTGKADIKGKEYLIELTKLNFPVIPTIESLSDLERLPNQDTYTVKLKNGADSIGMKNVDRDSLSDLDVKGYIVQPFIDFQYEVSFYYIDGTFQYAMYAADKHKRWELQQYKPTAEDLIFAQMFIDWNDLEHGIQRVDACRTATGELLLVELEDLNPYLSLLLLDEETKSRFIENFSEALLNAIAITNSKHKRN
jgi:hypothetical protein